MAGAKNSLRTPLGRVRGLGAAKRGTEHFVVQRVTAIALVPLTLWFIWAVAAHAGAPAEVAGLFLSHPVNAGLMLLFTATAIWHFKLGVQVVIEDYITGEGLKIAALLANTFFAVALIAACALAVLKLAV